MNLIRRTHTAPFLFGNVDPFAGFDALFDSFSPAARAGEREPALIMPATDIHETATAYEVAVELPGVQKDDIRVSLQDGVLAIEAENRRESEEKKDGTVIRRERRYGRFVRRFALGPDVQEDKVEAKFEHGVLVLNIPKAVPVTVEPRRIAIR
ncbi:MAG: Hsp20/alpha crystallin family protein [Pseudomonadota bacterium]